MKCRSQKSEVRSQESGVRRRRKAGVRSQKAEKSRSQESEGGEKQESEVRSQESGVRRRRKAGVRSQGSEGGEKQESEVRSQESEGGEKQESEGGERQESGVRRRRKAGVRSQGSEGGEKQESEVRSQESEGGEKQESEVRSQMKKRRRAADFWQPTTASVVRQTDDYLCHRLRSAAAGRRFVQGCVLNARFSALSRGELAGGESGSKLPHSKISMRYVPPFTTHHTNGCKVIRIAFAR
jgi:hypothetical protein